MTSLGKPPLYPDDDDNVVLVVVFSSSLRSEECYESLTSVYSIRLVKWVYENWTWITIYAQNLAWYSLRCFENILLLMFVVYPL